MTFSACLASPDGWHWVGGGEFPPLPLAPSHGQAFKKLVVDAASPCARMTGSKELHDRECDHDYNIVCEIFFGFPGIGSSIGNLL